MLWVGIGIGIVLVVAFMAYMRNRQKDCSVLTMCADLPVPLGFSTDRVMKLLGSQFGAVQPVATKTDYPKFSPRWKNADDIFYYQQFDVGERRIDVIVDIVENRPGGQTLTLHLLGTRREPTKADVKWLSQLM